MLRRAGLFIDSVQTRRFAEVLALLGFERRDDVKAAGRAVFVRRRRGDAGGAPSAPAGPPIASSATGPSRAPGRPAGHAPDLARRGRRAPGLAVLATPYAATPDRPGMRHFGLDGAVQPLPAALRARPGALRGTRGGLRLRDAIDPHHAGAAGARSRRGTRARSGESGGLEWGDAHRREPS